MPFRLVPICLISDPFWQKWLTAYGSLTRAIIDATEQPLEVASLTTYHKPFKSPTAHTSTLCLARDVLLTQQNQLLLSARSFTPLATNQSPRFLHALRSQKPLGSHLFTQGWSRTQIQVGRIISTDGLLWARRSVFSHDQQWLVIEETFSPSFKGYFSHYDAR